MAYKELIKKFNQTREYIRSFLVYGFRSRLEFDGKSARSYDNERRRVESWLGDYVAFRTGSAGKNVYLSVDSREILHNPLYRVFKAKSFTKNDIRLHFYLMDILAEHERLTLGEICDGIAGLTEDVIEESLVRKKLKEYVSLGLVRKESAGREIVYSRTGDFWQKEPWSDALAFFSEADPVGVIGSYLLDRYEQTPDYFRFKHHYILHALDCEVLCDILLAMQRQKKLVLAITWKDDQGEPVKVSVCPMKIYISSETGREYLLAWSEPEKKFRMYRLDHILTADESDETYLRADYEAGMKEFCRYLWGVSVKDSHRTEHVEMTLRVEPEEYFIVERLNREKRNGTVEKIHDRTYQYTVDVYDAMEMLPWIRSFTGRIESITSSNPELVRRVRGSIREMKELYLSEDGGTKHAVS